MMTTKSLNELKTIYMSIVNDALTNNLDTILDTTNALLNKDVDAKNKYDNLQKICADKMKAQISEEEYKLLQPHIVEMVAEVAKQVLPRLKN